MKKLSSFVDKMAEKARLRRAQHKGGRVPGVLKKVNVEFYVSDEDKDKIEGEEKDPGKVQKVEMFDLMLKRGTTVKAYSKQEEEQRRALSKLKKLGISSIKELDQQIFDQVPKPKLLDDIRKTGGARSSEDPDSQQRKEDESMSSSENDDLLEEFKRETEREKIMAAERE